MDRPIIFSAPMVRALLDGRKTQTRRVLKPQPPSDVGQLHVDIYNPTVIDRNGDECPGKPVFGVFSEDGSWALPIRIRRGDRLWVREASTRFDKGSCDQWVWYRAGWNLADDASSTWIRQHFPDQRSDEEWHAAEGPAGGAPYHVSPIYMPRWASRLTLTVTDVRVQRLQDISEEDAQAEGAELDGSLRDIVTPTYRAGFARIWAGIHEPSLTSESCWGRNPWIAAYTFTVERRNIDAPLPPAGEVR